MAAQGGICTVHVQDEVRHMSRDFTCRTDMLVSSMRYFQCYLKDVKPQQNVVISVHCDVDIFERLLAFADKQLIPGSTTTQMTNLSVSTVMPILIASHFLGMDELVSLCVGYTSQNLAGVASASPDLAALPAGLLQRIAKAAPEEQLEALHATSTDHRRREDTLEGNTNKLSQQPSEVPGASNTQQLIALLYKFKLEQMLQELGTTVVRCQQCGAMFSLAHQARLGCSAARRHDGTAGWGSRTNKQSSSHTHHSQPQQHPHSCHVIDPDWHFQDHIASLKDTQQTGKLSSSPDQASWRDIYWDVWGVLHVLFCQHCGQFFPAQEMPMCCYHPEPAIYLNGRSNGRYPCCGSHAQRELVVQGATSAVELPAGGCCMRDHLVVVAPTMAQGLADTSRVLQLLQTFRQRIVPTTTASLVQVHASNDHGGEEDFSSDCSSLDSPLQMSARHTKQATTFHGDDTKHMQYQAPPSQGTTDKRLHPSSGMYDNHSMPTSRPTESTAERRSLNSTTTVQASANETLPISPMHSPRGPCILLTHAGQQSNTGKTSYGLTTTSAEQQPATTLAPPSGQQGLQPARDFTLNYNPLDGAVPCVANPTTTSQATHAYTTGTAAVNHTPGSVSQIGVRHADGVPWAAGSQTARKLKLELLHEDDVARMDALIAHLAACRQSHVGNSSNQGTATASNTATHDPRVGSLRVNQTYEQPARARQYVKDGPRARPSTASAMDRVPRPSTASLSRSSSTSRPARKESASSSSIGNGAAGPGFGKDSRADGQQTARPLSAPRSRPKQASPYLSAVPPAVVNARSVFSKMHSVGHQSRGSLLDRY